jgi:hypothetical protein
MGMLPDTLITAPWNYEASSDARKVQARASP